MPKSDDLKNAPAVGPMQELTQSEVRPPATTADIAKDKGPDESPHGCAIVRQMGNRLVVVDHEGEVRDDFRVVRGPTGSIEIEKVK